MIRRESLPRWKRFLESIAENKKLLRLIEQHEANTALPAETIVADHKYGTQENYVGCAERGLTSHMGDAAKNQKPRSE